MKAKGLVAYIVLLLILIGFNGTLSAQQAQVWWEWQVSRVTTGYDTAKRQWVQEAYYIAAISPGTLSNDLSPIAASCVRKNKQAINIQLRNDLRSRSYHLDEGITFKGIKIVGLIDYAPQKVFDELQGISKKAPDQIYQYDIQRVERALTAASSELSNRLHRCSKGKIKQGDVVLTLSRRYCGSGSSTCSGNTPAFSSHPAALAHERITDWVTTKLKMLKSIKINDIVLVAPGSAQVAALSKMDGSTISNPNAWKSPPAALQHIDDFQSAVLKLRASKQGSTPKLSSIVPFTLNLNDATGFRIMDVVDDPRRAVERLAAAADVKVAPVEILNRVSDEIARSRIKECVRFRGLGLTASADQYQQCTGYTVSQDQVKACLRGEQCMPNLAMSGRADVLMIAEALTADQLSRTALLPRITVNVNTAITSFNECLKSSQGSKERCAATVFIKKNPNIAPWVQEVPACMNKAKTSEARTQCLLANAPSGNPIMDAVKECATKAKNKEACLMETHLRRSLPKEVTVGYQCASKYKPGGSQFAECIVKGTNLGQGMVGRVATCAAATRNRPHSTFDVALCLADGSVPAADLQNARMLGDCYTKNNGDYKNAAGCWAASQIPVGGDLKLAAQCYAESGGSYFGTASCMMGSQMNAESMIALQCAQSTGGEPSTFATCVAGQLTMKELVQCQGKNFGEDPCFGQNNEFRRLARNLLGQDIGPNSVIAQVMNVQLDAVKFQLEMAKTVAEAGGRLLADISRTGGEMVEAAGKAVEKIAASAGLAVENTVRETKEAIERALPPPPPPIQLGTVGGHRVCLPWC